MSKPHHHYTVIVAWAEGKAVEVSENGVYWGPLETCNDPWGLKYARIKPERTFPETSLTDEQLITIANSQAHYSFARREIANAAIKQFILDNESSDSENSLDTEAK